MSLVTLKGHPKFGMPKKTHVRIESLPDRVLVDLQDVTRSYSRDFDPGKYIASFTTEMFDELGGLVQHVEEFYVDCDEKTFKRLHLKKPIMSRSFGTTNGIVWRCGAKPGCKNEAMSSFAAYVHEQAHFGVDVLDPSVPEGDMQEATASLLKAKEEEKSRKLSQKVPQSVLRS